MPIKLDTTIGQVGQSFAQGLRVGYTPQIDPGPFVRAYDSTIQAGQQLQNLGTQFAEFTSKQAAIENDNFVNNQLLDFEKEKTKALTYLTTNPKAKSMLPSKYSAYITDKLTTFRSNQLTKIPQTRLEAFKLKTEESLMGAQAFALKHMKKVNDDQYDVTTLKIREAIIEEASNPTVGVLFDKETAINNFTSRLNNGVTANVYLQADAQKKLDKFKEDLADTVWNRREQIALQDPQTTLDTIVKLGEEISVDPDLDLQAKFKRSESLLNRWNTQQTRKRQLLEDLADEQDFKQITKLMELVTTERQEKQNPNQPTITDEIIEQAIKDGLHTVTMIKFFKTIANRQEDLSHLGDEDNEPDKGYLDDIKKIELKAIEKEMTGQQLKIKLDEILKKATFEAQHKARTSEAPGTRLSEANLTSVELTRITGEITRVVKDFKDKGETNFKSQKTQAKQAIRRLYGGSDQFLQKYNLKRENLLADAYNTARLLIKGGERWDVAVEKVRPLVQEVTGVGINRFKGVSARDLVIKARKSQLSDDDRFVLQAMAARKREREAKEIKTIKQGLKDEGRLKTKGGQQELQKAKQRIIDPGLPQKKEKQSK